MRIDELIWDAWNEEHLARHPVEPEEVEEAVFDPSSLFFATTREGERRCLVLGLTEAGRYLLVVRSRSAEDGPTPSPRGR